MEPSLPQVTIAAQVYDFIDKHIQSLDGDMRSLDGEIRADRERLRLGEDEAAADRLDAGKPRGRGRPAVGPAETQPKKRGRKRVSLEPAEEEDGAQPPCALGMHACVSAQHAYKKAEPQWYTRDYSTCCACAESSSHSTPPE